MPVEPPLFDASVALARVLLDEMREAADGVSRPRPRTWQPGLPLRDPRGYPDLRRPQGRLDMDRTALSGEGQVVIPGAARDAHRSPSGTERVIEDAGDAVVPRPREPSRATRLVDGLACTGYRGPVHTVEEMGERVARAVRWRRRDRGA